MVPGSLGSLGLASCLDGQWAGCGGGAVQPQGQCPAGSLPPGGPQALPAAWWDQRTRQELRTHQLGKARGRSEGAQLWHSYQAMLLHLPSEPLAAPCSFPGAPRTREVSGMGVDGADLSTFLSGVEPSRATAGCSCCWRRAPRGPPWGCLRPTPPGCWTGAGAGFPPGLPGWVFAGGQQQPAPEQSSHLAPEDSRAADRSL